MAAAGAEVEEAEAAGKVKSPHQRRGFILVYRLKPRTESPKKLAIHPHPKKVGLSGTVVIKPYSLKPPLPSLFLLTLIWKELAYLTPSWLYPSL